jgi:5-methylcytosine-specific restriction protein A
MARRRPRVCGAGGCNTLTTTGRCEKHLTGWAGYQREKGTAADRGYASATWRALRKTIIHRDGGLCQECKRNGLYRRGAIVDHIQPKAWGGTDDPSNLQLLCPECDRIKTASEGGGARVRPG